RPGVARLDGDGHALPALPQFLLRPFGLRDVASEHGAADDGARSIVNGRDREGDIDPTAVLAAAHSLVPTQSASARQVRHYPFELVQPIRRYDQRDVTADSFCRAVTVDLLRGRVPANDRPIEALANDRVV